MKRPVFHRAKPLLAVAALAAFGLGGLWGNVHFVRQRHLMLAELAALRGDPIPPKWGEARGQAMAAIARLSRELDRENALLAAAESTVSKLQKSLPVVDNEEVRSFGQIEQMGQEAALFLPQLLASFERWKSGGGGRPSEDESSQIVDAMLGWLNRLEAVGELEGNASEIARFHAATLQARLGLDGDATKTVQHQLEREFRELNARGLARTQRPDTDQDKWYELRKSALDEATVRIEAILPVARRQPHVVGQSLYLGTGMRSRTKLGAPGESTVSVGLDLPGMTAIVEGAAK